MDQAKTQRIIEDLEARVEELEEQLQIARDQYWQLVAEHRAERTRAQPAQPPRPGKPMKPILIPRTPTDPFWAGHSPLPFTFPERERSNVFNLNQENYATAK